MRNNLRNTVWTRSVIEMKSRHFEKLPLRTCLVNETVWHSWLPMSGALELAPLEFVLCWCVHCLGLVAQTSNDKLNKALLGTSIPECLSKIVVEVGDMLMKQMFTYTWDHVARKDLKVIGRQKTGTLDRQFLLLCATEDVQSRLSSSTIKRSERWI